MPRAHIGAVRHHTHETHQPPETPDVEGYDEELDDDRKKAAEIERNITEQSLKKKEELDDGLERTKSGRVVQRDARGRARQSGSAKEASKDKLKTEDEKFGQFVQHLTENEEAAAHAVRILQRKCLAKVASHCLNRERLIDRLTLEAKLLRSIFMILVYIALFIIMCVGDSFTTAGGQLSLSDYYKGEFGLEDLEEVTTIEEFNEYLAAIEETSRKLTPTSDMYFEEKEEIKLIGAPEEFNLGPKKVESDDIKVRVDQMEFSFTAWVKAEQSATGYIVRKPLDKGGYAYADSCWGWYHDYTPGFHFGAHDFGGLHTVAEQEYATVDRSHGHYAPGWHLEAVIVRQDRIEFWENRDLLQTVSIKRPVTDCKGNFYELGAVDFNLAMLIFYPYALSGFEIQEIFEDGSSLNAIAQGMQQYYPTETEFERITSDIKITGEQWRAGSQLEIWKLEIGHVLTREITGAAFGAHAPPHVVHAHVHEEVDHCEHSPACRFITGVQEYNDSITGYKYYDLLPLSMSPGKTMLGLRHLVHLERDRHGYALDDFPPEIGEKFSFSWWAKPYVAGGYLIGKFKDTTHDYPCWSVYMASDQIELHAFEEDHKVVLAKVELPSDRNLDDYALTEGPMLRHMMLTVNEVDRRIRFYLDGQYVGETAFKYPKIKHLDCPSDPGTYIAAFHRAPGSQDLVGEFQQVRLYAGVELSHDDAHHLEDQSTDPKTGKQLRECHYPGEIFDDPFFADAQGHGCLWYSEANFAVPGVCTAPYVYNSCPVGCNLILPCLQPKLEGVERDVAWERVMHVMPPPGSEPKKKSGQFGSSEGSSSDAHRRLAGGGGGGKGGYGRPPQGPRAFGVCLAEHVEPLPGGMPGGHSSTSSSHSSSHSSAHRRLGGSASTGGGHSSQHVPVGGHPEPEVPQVPTDHADIIKRCKELRDSNHPDYHMTEYRRSHLKITDGYLYLKDHYPYFFLDVLDCDWLDRSIDDYCAFKVPHSWTTYFDQKIVASGEFTVTFWLRPYGPESLTWDSFMPTVQFFSELAPPDVFFTLFTLKGHSPRVEAYIHMHNNTGAHGIEVGATLSLVDWTHISVVFGTKDDKGHQEVSLMVNGDFMTDYMPSKWVPSHSGHFLQAMVFSPDMLVSPVEFIDHAEPIEVLQRHYYAERYRMSLRNGPLSKEHDRLHHKIEYETARFMEPGFLGAPPLVLQDRRARSDDCPHESGTFAIRSLWQKVVHGGKCGWPFDCSDNFEVGPTALFACSWTDIPDYHFGRKHHEQKVGSLTGREVFSEFLPTLTRTPFVVRDNQDYDTSHYLDQMTQDVTVNFMFISPQLGTVSELEIKGDMQKPFNKVDYHMAHYASLGEDKVATIMIIAVLTAVCGVCILGDSLVRTYRLTKGDSHESATSVVSDVVIGLFVIVFFVIRAGRTANLTSSVEHVMDRMMNIPWASHDYSYDEKEKEFFDVMSELETRIEEVNAMRLVFFALLLLVITRTVFLLSAHPRVAMMIDTLAECRSQLWQLIMLFLILLLAFGMVARALFGDQFHEFASLNKTLETEYLMFMGELFDFFGAEWKITFFFLLYQFLMFFLLVNFLLAIIMDTFTAVKERCANYGVDQEFFMDLFSACQVKFLRMRYNWPRNEDIIRGLESVYGLKYVNVARLGNENDYFGKIGMIAGMNTERWTTQSRLRFIRFYASKFSGVRYEYDPAAYEINDTENRQINHLSKSSKNNLRRIRQMSVASDGLIKDVNKFLFKSSTAVVQNGETHTAPVIHKAITTDSRSELQDAGSTDDLLTPQD